MSWNITGSHERPENVAIDVGSFGLSSIFDDVFHVEREQVYTVENSETRETREVTARNTDEVGEKIANGDFNKK